MNKYELRLNWYVISDNSDQMSIPEILSMMAHGGQRGRGTDLMLTSRLPKPALISRLLGQTRAYTSAGFIDYGNVPEFTERWTKFFNEEAHDQFELLRGLNNCFSYDIVPPVPVLEAALKAARRLNDFATAVRVFGGLKEKTENDLQYDTYMEHLGELKAELGIPTPEELGRE